MSYKFLSKLLAFSIVASFTSIAVAEDDDRLSWFTVAPEMGFLYHPNISVTQNSITASIDSRPGFIGKIHLDLGGKHFGFEIAPFWFIEHSDGYFGTLNGGGVQTNLVFRFHAKNFYPSIGVGTHLGFMGGDDIAVGMEFYWRFPIGLTYYFSKHLGFVVEFAPMYGWTGIMINEVSAEFDAELSEQERSIQLAFSDNLGFGGGGAFELSVGLRFP